LPPMDRGRENGYLLSGDHMLKRHADYLEKLSVAAMVMGLFHGHVSGIIIGIASYLGCMYLTKKIGG